ncbi:hypothetical protein J132_01521 [Termitomyces sp. J132]|nr:hypothetical protein C0989_008078 [Termitomyces sp. Mn162]KAH0591538.1 hypothetical protein H2248_001600 [Termitomyces sp. 'cryptogamus']KNZ73008.1 hypothetical protein J132_01521 [Termitomyces sp. J132]
MSSATITINYELNPPAQIAKETQGLTTSKTLRHVVEAKPSEVGLEAYCAALRVAIAKAKDQLGDELTEWRDAVGKAELSKETPKTLKYDADEAEEED